MKIINQTADEMILKEGSMISIIVSGSFFILAGSYSAYAILSKGTAGWIIFVPIIFALAGLLWILLSATIAVSIQKISGLIRYEKKRLVGTKLNTYNISDVVRVELRKQWQTERVQGTQGDSSTSYTRQVLVSQSVIVFKDGTELPLGQQSTSSGMSGGLSVLMGGQGKEMAFATQIAEFIGVPFQEVAPPSIGTGIGAALDSIGKILN